MDISYRNDVAAGDVLPRRHPGLVVRNDTHVAVVEHATDGDVVADDAVGGIRSDRSFRSVLPHGGRQLSWFYGLVRHRGIPKAGDEMWGVRRLECLGR